MKIPDNYVAVRVRKAFDGGALLHEDGRPAMGLGGKLLVQADEGLHQDEELINKPGAVCIAQIVTPCARFTKHPEVLAIDDVVYGSEFFLQNEVVAGDVVAVKQSEFDFDTPAYTDEGGAVHLVPYWALLCIIKGAGQLVPVGGYTLATPVMPARAMRELVQGKVEWVIKNGLGLVEQTGVQPLLGQGQLVFVGRALLGQPMPFYPGQRVLYSRWTSGPKYRIQNVDYYAVRHPDIAAVLPADADVVSSSEGRYSRTIKRPERTQ